MPPDLSSTHRVTILLGFAAALVFVLLWAATSTRGQQVSGMEAMDFKVQLENYPPPNESQIKTLLEGARAEPQTEGIILLTDAKLKTFNTNGLLSLTARSPVCTFDSVQRTVSSTGMLYVQSADNRFALEGLGFLLLQTNSHLLVSNRVHTTILNVPGKSRKP